MHVFIDIVCSISVCAMYEAIAIAIAGLTNMANVKLFSNTRDL